MKAVANSSVLIALSAIGRLSLLRERFPDGLLIPDAVWREVVETGRGRPGALVAWLCYRKPVAQDGILRYALRKFPAHKNAPGA